MADCTPSSQVLWHFVHYHHHHRCLLPATSHHHLYHHLHLRLHLNFHLYHHHIQKQWKLSSSLFWLWSSSSSLLSWFRSRMNLLYMSYFSLTHAHLPFKFDSYVTFVHLFSSDTHLFFIIPVYFLFLFLMPLSTAFMWQWRRGESIYQRGCNSCSGSLRGMRTFNHFLDEYSSKTNYQTTLITYVPDTEFDYLERRRLNIHILKVSLVYRVLILVHEWTHSRAYTHLCTLQTRVIIVIWKWFRW